MTNDTALSPHRVAAIVLAAGSSRRAGPVNKLLVAVDGRPMVHTVCENLVSAGLTPVVVVTGFDAEAVQAALGDVDVRYTHNADHEDGMASSLRTGIAALAPETSGALIALADMPWVKPSTLQRLVSAFRDAGAESVCRPVHDGRPGNPVVFPKRLFAALSDLRGDVGGKAVVAAEGAAVRDVDVDDPGIFRDMDVPTPEAPVTKSS